MLRPANRSPAPSAKQAGQIGLRFSVHCDRKHLYFLLPGVQNRPAGILDSVTAFVIVSVIGLAVAEYQQQSVPLGTLCQKFCAMTNGRPHTGIVARLQSLNSSLYPFPHNLIKGLQGTHPNLFSPSGGKTVDGVVVAGQRLAVGQSQQRFPGHIDYPPVLQPGIRRQGDIHQNIHRQIPGTWQ